MADSTEHESKRVTSGRRALVAAWVRRKTHLPVLYSIAWADACAALVEDGWSTASRALLTRMLDPTAGDQAARLLLGGIPPMPDDLTLRRLARAVPELRAPAGPMPAWAIVGVQLGDEIVYARPTLDLDVVAHPTSAHQRVDARLNAVSPDAHHAS